MDGLRSVWRRSGEKIFGESSRLPERDEHVAVADSLLSELDFHVRELDRLFQQREREERRQKTGVDYSWLMASAPKTYEIPQLERLELEELCLKLEVQECSKVIALFRDAILREPRVEDLVRIMRSCVIQVLEHRPRSTGSATLPEWVSQRASSLINLKFKSPTRVGPAHNSLDDIEMQAETSGRQARALSMPNFTVTSTTGNAVCIGEGNRGSLPV